MSRGGADVRESVLTARELRTKAVQSRGADVHQSPPCGLRLPPCSALRCFVYWTIAFIPLYYGARS